jgi:lipopolysaccharide/colanic/teichoic acid biosynthesis glycosyltransferase
MESQGEFCLLESVSAEPVLLESARNLSLLPRAAAAVALAAAVPVLAAAGVAIYLLSGRGPLIRHRRVGYRGETLRMLKIRTMWEGNGPANPFRIEEMDSWIPDAKSESDPRVTSPVAAFCRRHSIDELPQLWHVVRGEMAWIGPRPITATEWRKYYGDPCSEVLAVRPGLVGLWQVMGRNRLTYAQRRRLDVFLARRTQLGLHWRIFGRAIVAVFTGKDAY